MKHWVLKKWIISLFLVKNHYSIIPVFHYSIFMELKNLYAFIDYENLKMFV